VTVLALRLSAPLQSWSGYRLAVSKDAVVPTESMPRKSGVNGLIGAAVGSRNLDEIGAEYELYVRIDHINPTTEDYQTLGPLPGYVSADHPGRATALADRAEKIRTAQPVPTSSATGTEVPSPPRYPGRTTWRTASTSSPSTPNCGRLASGSQPSEPRCS